MIDEILNEADNKSDKSVEATREAFAAIRAGRVSRRSRALAFWPLSCGGSAHCTVRRPPLLSPTRATQLGG